MATTVSTFPGHLTAGDCEAFADAISDYVREAAREDPGFPARAEEIIRKTPLLGVLSDTGGGGEHGR